MTVKGEKFTYSKITQEDAVVRISPGEQFVPRGYV